MVGYFWGSTDNQTADHRCQACGYPKVRFIHKLSHPSLVDTILLAGFICAGQLTGKPDLLQCHESELRRIGRMRDQFLKRGWSSYHQDNGLGLAFRREENFTFMLKEQTNGTWTLYRTGYRMGSVIISEGHDSKTNAMIAAFRILHDAGQLSADLEAERH